MAGKITDDTTSRLEQEMPPAGKLVLVMCDSDHFIGYLDERGNWRHAVHHKQLYDVVGWCALSAKGW